MARAACVLLPRAAGFRCAHCWTAAGECFAIASLGSLLAAEPSYALRIAWLHRIVARHAAASQCRSVRWHCAGRAGQQLGAALQFPGAESKENARGKKRASEPSSLGLELRMEVQCFARARLRSAARGWCNVSRGQSLGCSHLECVEASRRIHGVTGYSSLLRTLSRASLEPDPQMYPMYGGGCGTAAVVANKSACRAWWLDI